jgi:predicted Rossmann fold flavoprotein
VTRTKDIIQNTKSYSSSKVEKFSTRSDNNTFDVAVVGAGPAGILAAIFAARSGADVIIIEKNDQIGRKILATGNGRCNITNKEVTASKYHGRDTSFVRPILLGFDQNTTIQFFTSVGVPLKEEDHGRIFPVSDRASDVVNALKKELQRLNVKVTTGFIVKSITPISLSSPTIPTVLPAQVFDRETDITAQTESAVIQRKKKPDSWPPTRNDESWEVTGEDGQLITADNLILTTGGKAAHQFGSSGDGLFWAAKLGHHIVPIHAALVPFEVEENIVKEIMGIKLPVLAHLITEEKKVASKEGDILFTHYGVSGPAAMGVAREVDPILLTGKKCIISIDITPRLSENKLSELLIDLISKAGKKCINSVLLEILPKKLSPIILNLARVNPDTKAAEVSKKERQQIISTIKDFRLTIKKVRPLREAQVMAGGIDTREIAEDLSSKIIPNLYFAGEILDIDGDSGGFNLQWAWSSGKVAGEAAAKANR